MHHGERIWPCKTSEGDAKKGVAAAENMAGMSGKRQVQVVF